MQFLLKPLLLLPVCHASRILFESATIISFDDATEQFRVLRDSSLLVEDDRISRVSEGSLAGQIPIENLTVIDARNKIISPGFVDTHHHVWSTLFKTLGPNTDLGIYFQRFGAPGPAGLEGGFTPEDTYISQLAGYLETISEGTTTVLDHAHGCFSEGHTEEAMQATLDSGARSFFAFTVQELPNGWPTGEQIEVLELLAQDPRLPDSNGRVSLGLSYDNYYLGQTEEIDALWSIVDRYNLSVVTGHYSPITPQLLLDLGLLNSTVPIVFSHADTIDTANSELLREYDQYISTTPESEFQYGINNQNSHLIMDQGSLGTDTHIQFSSSMVQQARLWLQVARYRNYLDVLNEGNLPRGNPMSVAQAFSLITRHGGLALRRPDIGVIREGAKADLNVFNTDSPTMLGWHDPIAAIILHSNPGDIEHVLVDGNFVKRDFQLTFPNYSAFRQRFQTAANRIQSDWLAREWP